MAKAKNVKVVRAKIANKWLVGWLAGRYLDVQIAVNKFCQYVKRLSEQWMQSLERMECVQIMKQFAAAAAKWLWSEEKEEKSN